MYVKINAQGVVEKYPYTIEELRQDYPNTSFPANIDVNPIALAEYDTYSVLPGTQPTFDEYTQKLVETVPVKVNSDWVKAWNIIELSTKEKESIRNNKINDIRSKRNILLTECDWTQLPDAPANSVTWAVYRQELRDITIQEGYPFNVIWPTKPE